jgi:PTH2 family peptidyl-tRNA hydrolase
MEYSEKYKQVIVIRTDIEMKTGKKCAQACHASLAAADVARAKNTAVYNDWKKYAGQRKIVLKITSEADIQKLYNEVVHDGIPAYLIADAGLTQLEPGTITALGIGPDLSEKIDRHCKDLKLL